MSLHFLTPDVQNFSHIISDLFQSGKYSDLTIMCKGREWKVHRAIVFPQAKSLEAISNNVPKGPDCQKLRLDQEDPEILERFVKFLYTGDFDENSWTSSASLYSTSTGAPTPSTSSNRNHSASSTSVFKFDSIAPNQLFGEPQKPFPQNEHFLANPVSILEPPSKSSSLVLETSTKVNSSKGEPEKHPPSIFDGVSAATRLDTTPTTNIFSKLNLSQSAGGVSSSKTNKPQPTFHPKALVVISKVYILANEYEIQPLKHLARKKYAQKVPKMWNSVFFAESLQLIHDRVPSKDQIDPLREVAMRFAGHHARELFEMPEFQKLCRERGDIATDILKATLATSMPQGSRYLPKKTCKLGASHTIAPVVGIFSNGREKCLVCNEVLTD